MAGSDAVARCSRAGLAGRAIRRLAPDGRRRRDRLPLRDGVAAHGDLDFVAGHKDRAAVESAMAEAGFAPDREFNHPPRAPAPLLRGSGRTADRRLHGPDGHVPHARPARSAPALQPDRAAGRSRPEQASDRSVHGEGPPGHASPARAHRDRRAPRRDRPPADRRSDVRRTGAGTRPSRRTWSDSARRAMSPAHARVELLELMNGWPKTRRWTMRARVGTRKKWYRLPEEVAHGSSAGGG